MSSTLTVAQMPKLVGRSGHRILEHSEVVLSMSRSDASLLDLPAELRRQIYGYAYGHHIVKFKYGYFPYPSESELSIIQDVAADDAEVVVETKDIVNKACNTCQRASLLPRRTDVCWSCNVRAWSKASQGTGPNLLFVCRQMHQESIDLFFERITPEFDDPGRLLSYASTVRTHGHADLVRSIAFRVDFWNYNEYYHVAGFEFIPSGCILIALRNFVKPEGLKRAFPRLKKVTINFVHHPLVGCTIAWQYADLHWPDELKSVIDHLGPYLRGYGGLEVRADGLAGKEAAAFLQKNLEGLTTEGDFDFNLAADETLVAYEAGGQERRRVTNFN